MSSNGNQFNPVATAVFCKNLVDLHYDDAFDNIQAGNFGGALRDLATGAEDGLMDVIVDRAMYGFAKKALPVGSLDTGFLKSGF